MAKKQKTKPMFSLRKKAAQYDARQESRRAVEAAGVTFTREQAAGARRFRNACALFSAAHEGSFRNVAVERFHFLEQIGQPEYVEVDVWEKSEPGECHRDVMNYVDEHGGAAVQGYRVYENDHQLNGEVHAVWKSGAGKLLDISPPWSPRCDGDPTCRTRVTFIPLDELEPGLSYDREGFVIHYNAEHLIELQRPFLETILGDKWIDWSQKMRDEEGIAITGDR